MNQKKPRLSIVCNTARASYSMPGDMKDIHIFDLLVSSLSSQIDAPPFELVVADTEFDTRPTWFEDNPPPFPVKHVPVESWWLDNGLTAISRCKNVSVLHAEGDRIITVDDSTGLPPHFLALAWELFEQGVFPVAWYDVVEDSKWKDPRLDMIPAGQDVLVSDMTGDAWERGAWQLHGWGYVGFTAAAFYGVNGYEEWYDGGRGQEDIEFSLRLLREGHRLAVHRRLWVDILPQGPVAVYRNPAIPTGVVHCTSGLSPILYKEIQDGTRTRANAEPFPARIRDRLYPVCGWYCPDRRHDKRLFTCDCGAGGAELFGEMLDTIGESMPCPDCGAPMVEDDDAAVALAGMCTLYRNPCPFATPTPGDVPPSHPDMHAHDPLWLRAFVEFPDQWTRELLTEHKKLTDGPLPKRGTFVGVDWRSR